MKIGGFGERNFVMSNIPERQGGLQTHIHIGNRDRIVETSPRFLKIPNALRKIWSTIACLRFSVAAMIMITRG
jgi:hypothetical protein